MEEVRHLGVTFTPEGVLNTVGAKLEKVTWTLTSLKRFGTNFLARANLVKSYALSALTYLAAHVPLRTTESDFSTIWSNGFSSWTTWTSIQTCLTEQKSL